MSAQSLELVRFIDALQGINDKMAKVLEVGTPLEWTHYEEFRVTGKQEDYKYPCCDTPTAPKPTIYDASKFTYSGGVEVGLLAKKTVGFSLVLSTIPATKALEKWSGIGDKMDRLMKRMGGGCQMRGLVEANANIGLSAWAPAAPCEKCPIDMNMSGSVLGGGGMQCTAGPAASMKQRNLVQASLQSWGKVAPIGYAQACGAQAKWTWGNFDACVQYRVRYYDWLDIEGQKCMTLVSDVSGKFNDLRGAIGF